MFGTVPNVTIIAPSKGIKTIEELVAKAKSGGMSFSSAGVGSATHWAAERLRVSAGFNAVHVPFRGGPEALTEVLSGRVEFYFCPINTALPYIRDGRLLGLVVNSPKRAVELPDVPTTLEAGYRDADLPIWIGMFAPARSPGSIVDRLHSETARALQMPATRDKLAKTGIEPMIMSPAEFDLRVRREIETNGALARAAGIRPN
jgi:tripartite-type tricarboxylate transporter receptor subunit TctC